MSKPAANLTDQELKDHGNKLFAARKFEDAVSCYSKAIVSFLCVMRFHNSEAVESEIVSTLFIIS